jgi:hypothetical protein
MALLRLLGFEERPRKSGSSHQDFVRQARGKFCKVTVDCPKAPFDQFLISSMANQAGLTKKEFYAAHAGEVPANWPN